MGLNVGEQVLDAIEILIAELTRVDGDSYALRNNPTLPDLSFVNLPNLAGLLLVTKRIIGG